MLLLSRKRRARHVSFFAYRQMYSRMTESKLPHSDYAWVPGEQMACLDWASLKEDDTYMYFAHVDLDYPVELHDRDDQFPMAVERTSVSMEQLSAKQIEMFRESGQKETQVTLPMLLAHLGLRHEYLVHGLTLADWLRKGIRVTR